MLFQFSPVVRSKVGVQLLEHDFGNITQGQVVTHSFIISNNGGELLKLSNVKASCGCTVANPEKTN